MNIFFLDTHPQQAAIYHCDKHVVKMILESAQLLSNVHYHYASVSQLEKDFGMKCFKPTHVKHPCTIWACTSDKNYYWLWSLAYWLSVEYSRRYGKLHYVTKTHLKALMELPDSISVSSAISSPVQCMPDQYKNDDPVIAYRNYYKSEKSRFAKWRYSETPYWWN